MFASGWARIARGRASSQRRGRRVVAESARQRGGACHFEEGATIDALGAKRLVQVGDVPLSLVVERHVLTLLSRPQGGMHPIDTGAAR